MKQIAFSISHEPISPISMTLPKTRKSETQLLGNTHSIPSLHRWRIAISYLFHTSQLPSVSFLALGKDKRYIIISNLMDYLWSRIQKLEQIEITVTFFDYYCFWCEFLMKVYPRIPRILVNAFLIWSKQNYSLLPTLSLSVFDSINPKLILIQSIKCHYSYCLESEIRGFILDEMDLGSIIYHIFRI